MLADPTRTVHDAAAAIGVELRQIVLDSSNHVEAAERDMRSALRQLVDGSA